MDIAKVLERKDGVRMVIIPKKSSIKKGKFVSIMEINEEEISKKMGKEVKKNGRG